MRVGDRVYAIGSPLGYHNTFSAGMVSRFDAVAEFGMYRVYGMIQITAPISPGSSGGALLNDFGQVVGVTTATSARASAQALNFAIPIARADLTGADGGRYLLLPISETQPASVLSGAYHFSSDLFITFSGGAFALNHPNGTIPGTFRVSGNSVIFSHAMWGSDTWTIVDGNTLRDPEDDLWIRSAPAAALSGSYYFNSGLFMTFSDGAFTLTHANGTITGTFRLSGSSLILSQPLFGSDTWAILNEDTLRDPENDLWRRR